MRPSKQQDYQVITPRSPERILKRRVINNQPQYQIKWKGQDEVTWEPEDNVRKSLIEEYQQTNSSSSNSVNDKTPVIKQVSSSLRHPNYSEELLLTKQKEMSSRIQLAHPQKSDEIESVHLIITDEQCAFEVRWKPRNGTGVVPLSDYYQYEQFKLVSPMLFMNFLEVCIIGRENKSDIKFYAPGDNLSQRACLMKKVLLKNPKYKDAGKQPEKDIEEQKQNVQSELITPSKHVISFIQTDNKKSNANQSEQSEKKCQLDIPDPDSNPEQQQQQQSQQDPLDESQEPGEIQPQQEEQEEQRSISLDGQKD